MKHFIGIIGIFVLIINLVGCGIKSSEDSVPKSPGNGQNTVPAENIEELSNNASENDPAEENAIAWSDTLSLPVPKPDTEYIASWDYGIYCRMPQEKLEEYKKALEDDGWSLVEELRWNEFPHYTYCKDNMIYQLIDHTYAEEGSGVNNTSKDKTEEMEALFNIDSYILVNFSYGYEKKSLREKTISKAEAAQLIQEYINQDKDQMGIYGKKTGSNVTLVIERYLEDSFEKMGIQAFTAVNQSEKMIGNYLICNNLVYYIEDSLEETCVADIDQDGEAELLSLYGWGSGIYRIELRAYKTINPIFYSSLTKIISCSYYNCFVPKMGYGQLAMKKVNDTEVRLLEQTTDFDGKITKTIDYGRIILAEDGKHLIPEQLVDFPYDQWDYSYNQDSIQETEEDRLIKASLKEPPRLMITVNDTELNYRVRKVLWKEEEPEDKISFQEIFNEKEEIPQFESPRQGYEYKDLIYLDLGDISPDSIAVKDYLLTDKGDYLFDPKLAIDREVKIEGDGLYSFGLSQHFALGLSSSTFTYTNPSYRGFIVTCTFDEDKICEYLFILSLGPIWKNE